jgi:hypothetical protein
MRMMATRPVRNMTIMKLLKMENQWICRRQKDQEVGEILET